MNTIPVAIIGAGPYGLSLAAHLRSSGIPFRIFGEPMLSWSAHMPAGMRLKSDGFASDLYDPARSFTLKKYCHTHGIPYARAGLPVEIDTFIGYGVAFQKAMVPSLETTHVAALRRAASGFTLELQSGETVQAQHVVVATGITGFENIPVSLASLPPNLSSHSSARRDLSCFAGKEMIVIGAGSSATDVAASLRQHGASVTLVARHPVKFHEHQPRRSLWKKMTEPNFGLGPNFRSSVYTLAPDLFRRLPAHIRQRIVKNHLGPAGGWFMKDEVIGKVQMLCSHNLERARESAGRVELDIAGTDGTRVALRADHVIAATGYRVSLSRLSFLDETLIGALAVENGSPTLSKDFESTVPQLYFVGLAAAATFGPLLRFALGARFNSRRLAAHLRSKIARGRGTNGTGDIEPSSISVRQLGG